MASPFANWGAYFNAESRVNGRETRCLSRYYTSTFNPDGFVLCPEAFPGYTDTNGYQADLAIRRMIAPAGAGNWQISLPYVVFEGKGGNVATSWDEILDQLMTWLRQG